MGPWGGGEEERQGEAPTGLPLEQQLRGALQFWRELGASPLVLQWIEVGYDIPLQRVPEPWHQRNGPGVQEFDFFLDEHIPALLQAGALRVAESKPWGVSPLNVVPKSQVGKYRLILDLRHLNEHLRDVGSFKMETLARIRDLFQKGDWMCSMDLTSGYHHLAIKEEHRKYLGCEYKGVYYEWCVLPFGLSTAPAAFSKLMAQLANYWRRRGIRLSFYLDDWLLLHQDPAKAADLMQRVLADMHRAGISVNFEKSVLVPTRRLKHLGFIVDTEKGSFSLPVERRQKILEGLRTVLEAEGGAVRARELASLAGRLQSCSLALGCAVRLFTREMYAAVELRSSWRGMAPVSAGVREEARLWSRVLDEWDGQSIWGERLVQPRVLWVDASDSAVGGWSEGVDVFCFWERFSVWQSQQSSAYRELLGIRMLLELLVEEGLRGEQVLIWTDSDNAQVIIAHGSPKPHLNKLAKDIFLLCGRHSIFLQVKWVPREQNVKADVMSKQLTTGCWGLLPHWFQRLEELWGPHDVDRMAASWNTKLPRFNSKFRCRGSEAVDCFTQDWRGVNNYVCPDFHLLAKVLRHIRQGRATATVVVPFWPTAAFWPLLWGEAGWLDWVQGVMWFPEQEGVFHAEHSGSMLGKGVAPFPVLAVRLVAGSRVEE